MTPKILAVIPTLADDPSDTIRSLMKQTVKGFEDSGCGWFMEVVSKTDLKWHW